MKNPIEITFNDAYVNKMEKAGYFGNTPEEINPLKTVWLETMKALFGFGRPVKFAEFDRESDKVLSLAEDAILKGTSKLVLSDYFEAKRNEFCPWFKYH